VHDGGGRRLQMGVPTLHPPASNYRDDIEASVRLDIEEWDIQVPLNSEINTDFFRCIQVLSKSV
jgi:hypothetical protein